MKEQYSKAEIEIEEFSAVDVILTSEGNIAPPDPDEGDFGDDFDFDLT